VDKEYHLKNLNNPETTPEQRLASAAFLKDFIPPLEKAVCEIDLHIHSFYSDGYHSPSGRVFEARQRQMKAISLTDHDNFDGYPEALRAGKILNIEVVPGIEFYTNRPGIEVIAFWPDKDHFLKWLTQDGGREFILPLKKAKQKQLKQMISRVPECMAVHGLTAAITGEDIRRYVRHGVSTKGDISVIMWQKYGVSLQKKGIAADVKDFQARYTTRDDQLNVPLETGLDLSPVGIVRMVRQWGGLPGISHPTELRKKEGLGNAVLYEIIRELGRAGLQCLEVDGWRNSICPETGKHHTRVFAGMAAAHHKRFPNRPELILTNGSDDHNQPGEGLVLGSGRNRNLDPAYGRFQTVLDLRERQRQLLNLH